MPALLAAALAVLVSGYVVAGCSTAAEKRAEAHPVTAAMLISPAALGHAWKVEDTKHHGTTGLCPQVKPAAPPALATWVRRLSGPRGHELVQTAQTSPSSRAAGRAWTATVNRYSRCTGQRAQLVGAWRLSGIGKDGEMLSLRAAGTDHLVAVSRTGLIVTSAVLDGTGTPRRLLPAFAASTKSLCHAGAAGPCSQSAPGATAIPPPPSGQTAGALATIDLPQVGSVSSPWAGTDPSSGGPNLAASPCDRTDFTKLPVSGTARSRTFLIPQASLPHRFGLTESWAKLASPAAARKVLHRVRHEMATCPKRQLGSHVAERPGGPSYSLWRVNVQINARKQTAAYWMGIAAQGSWVAQVGFTPAGKADMSPRAFRSVVVRAQQRLHELG